MRANEFITEAWSQKYKRSINCSNPKGFSQKAHCQGRKKTDEEIEQLDEKCWDTHKQVGMKNKNGKMVPNCVPKESVSESRENYNGINMLFQTNNDELFVKASAGRRELGHVLFTLDGDYLIPQDLEVEEKYRGHGIAQAMYNYVKSKGYKIRRSVHQTDAGAGFWDKHRPGKLVWEKKYSDIGAEVVSEEQLEEDLRKWFKEKWVRFGPDGKIRGDCARGSEGEGKPKCLPQKKAHALGKKKRASAASRKRRQDPNPERQGKAKNVPTKSTRDKK
jgi:predicted GIY-YIG superfamily endonuclease